MTFYRNCYPWIAAIILCISVSVAGATDHNGTIEDFDHWSAADNPHVINGTVTVAEGGHLLIGPGVVVHSRQDCSLTIQGQLTIDGDPGSEVLFTREPGYNSPTSAITFSASGSGYAQDCVIELAGYGVNLLSTAGQVTLFRTTVRDCGTGIFHRGGGLRLESVTIRDNQYGLRCDDDVPQFLDEHIVVTDNSIGVWFNDVPNLTLTTPLTVSNSTSRGLWLKNCSLPTIDNVTLTNNAGYGALRFENCGDFMLGAGNVIGGAGQENAWPVTLELGSYPAAGCVIPASGNENDDIRVDGGASSVNGTWCKLPGVDYVLTSSGVTVSEGGMLTIEPGVKIRNEGAYGSTITVRGTLIANGAQGKEILFTREATAIQGGIVFENAGSGSLSYWIFERASTCLTTDTNATGTITVTDTELRECSTGLRIQGGTVRVGSTAISVTGIGIDCEHVVPEFLDEYITITGGSNGLRIQDVSNLELTTPIEITGATSAGICLINCPIPLIDNLVVGECTGSSSYGAFYMIRCGDFTLGPGNVIGGEGQENSWPVTIWAGAYPSEDCIIPSTGNSDNDIRVFGGISSGYSGTWRKFVGLDYVVTGTPTIAFGDTLTISPGVRTRFDASSSTGEGLEIEGTLVAHGEPGQEIEFTRNASNNWAGIEFTADGSGDLSHCAIEFAVRAIYHAGTGVVGVTECILSDGSIGIRSTSGTVTLSRNRIIGNSAYGIYLDGGTALFGESVEQWNDILDNGGGATGRGLRCGVGDIAAPYVWWGSVDPEEIAWSIYDGNDNGSLGIVEFTPYSNEAHQVVGATGVGDGDSATEIPARFEMAPGVPNPFNPTTLIRFDTTRPSNVRLTIHDVAGRTVATLVDGLLAAGRHEHTWRGCDDIGRSLPSGVYFSRIESAEGIMTRKLSLVR